ncbi:MAG: hypothetical protein JSU64_00060 [candidate division WOR-3 bacterium]|nr:MAG: hypothetical protein JSU64_00060 [candidate division WOR-3 bacterium]
MIVILALLNIIPANEVMVYETNDKGKIGTIQVTSDFDSLGYHIVYVSDRVIEVTLDSTDLSTLTVRKIIKNDTVLEITKRERFHVKFMGRKYRYGNGRAIYDRHTLDFALRGFEYTPGFRHMFRLHVPELTIVNAELEVLEEDVVVTPAGEFPCWKLKMKPRILFFNWVFFFYIEKEYPHRFVKYTDSSGKNSIILKSYGIDQ